MQKRLASFIMALMVAFMLHVGYAAESASAYTPLDYGRVENWIINDNADTSKAYDLIFFIGTSVMEPTQANGVAVPDEAARVLGYTNYVICGSQLAEDARVFCPMQRQMALGYALKYASHESILEDIAAKEPYADLAAALDYYFEHYNPGAQRPFVLAGHSQGAASVQVVLNRYFLSTDKRDYLKNMIAAYSTGYGVTEKDFAAWPNKEGRLHFAQGADDFNCLLSWNTEGPGEKGDSFLLADAGEKVLLINPLNWRRDGTYAGIEENQGALVKAKDGSGRYELSLLPEDLLDAQVDTQRGSVLSSSTRDYVSLMGVDSLWGGKSLHTYDGRGYYANMKSNLRQRLASFLAAK